jgi:hypothetical protein
MQSKFFNLGGNVVSLQHVYYVGPLDTDVKSHIGVTLHIFSIVVGGQTVKLEYQTKAEASLERARLLSLLDPQKCGELA